MSKINEFKTKLKALMEEYNVEMCLVQETETSFGLEVDLGSDEDRTYSHLLHEFDNDHIEGNKDGFKFNDIKVLK